MENWLKIKLKYCTDFIQQKYSDEDYSYIGLENIISGNGKFIETESVYDRSQSLIFQKDDVLFGKLRPYLSKVYHANKNGCCSSEFCVIRPNKKILPKFLWHILISPDFINKVNCSTYGTKMPRANADFIKNLQIPLPPFEIQQKIADILEKKCVAIDECIEKTKATIEKYKKLKASIITETVTKGIDNAKLKDSGIEWIGEIPEHWEIQKGKHIFTQRNNRGNDNVLQLLSPTQKYGVIPQNIYDEISGMTSVKLKEDTDLKQLKTIHKGDFCISLRSFQGGFEFSQYEGVVSPAYQVFFAKQNIENIYYKYLFKEKSFIKKINSFTLSLRDGKNISYSDFASMYLPVPPLSEQTAIANYLDTKCAEIDSLIEKKQQIVEKLEQYKKSIIFEYVTGKKEI